MSIKREIINDIEKEAKLFFANIKGCHDWSHVERVRNLALKIGKKEGANLEILELASILHDIGREEEKNSQGKICHAQKSAELAKKILKKYNIDDGNIESIIHCIKTHRFRKGNKPQTIEAKVLFDADKLDTMGAVGLGRAFIFAGDVGSKMMYNGQEKELAKTNKDYTYCEEDSAILEYEVKLKYLKDKIITKTGKNFAQRRHDFMKKFIEEFWSEVEGKH